MSIVVEGVLLLFIDVVVCMWCHTCTVVVCWYIACDDVHAMRIHATHATVCMCEFVCAWSGVHVCVCVHHTTNTITSFASQWSKTAGKHFLYHVYLNYVADVERDRDAER